MSAAVKGLLYDSARQQGEKKRMAAALKPRAEEDNSKEALRFRSKNSIKDSIERHIPDIEALYKKHLKLHPGMQGVVWVIFQISPGGKVMSAHIKTSSIAEKDFLIPFHDYILSNMHFQAIPEKVGTTSVEFPFEFSPDK